MSACYRFADKHLAIDRKCDIFFRIAIKNTRWNSMEVPIIKEIVIIFALSIGVLLICHRLKLPGVVGFLVTGVLCGPHGLGLVRGLEDVQDLATIGIVLLLFTVGMEFSIKNIVKYKYYFFGGGTIQVVATVLATVAVAKGLMDRSWGESVFFGFLVSLSSTAIVLRALEDRAESDSPHGRVILGMLIFQDIIAVPMMLLIPVLAGAGDKFEAAYLHDFAINMLILVTMAIVAFSGVPKLLYYVTQTRNRELFLLSVLTICFSVAWITNSIGLSLSLGAFLAGLVISESEYSDEAVGNVLPFQEIFTSFFFVSMGMLLDVGFVIEQPLLILVIALAILLLKAFIAGGSAVALGMPLRSAILAGVALSQVGEFSFVLAHSGITLGLTSDYNYQLFLAVSLLTMGVTPSLMNWASRIADLALKLPLPNKLKMGFRYSSDSAEHAHSNGHMIIAGFGFRGRHLARAAKSVGIPYLVLEMNPETVKSERKNGEPIRYGDPSHPSVLLHAGIRSAKTVAVVINDPVAAMHIVKLAKTLNPDAYVITRTRYFQEVPRFFQAGADDVIPDELGSSLEIFTRVLQKSNVPHAELIRCLNELRAEGYELLRIHNPTSDHVPVLPFDDTIAKIHTYDVQDGSQLIGKTIVQSELRKVHGLTILMIKRGSNTLSNVEADTTLQVSDSLVVIGSPDSIQKAKPLFQSASA